MHYRLSDTKGEDRIFAWGGARFPEDFLGGGRNWFRGGRSPKFFLRVARKKIVGEARKKFWGSPPLNQLRPPLKTRAKREKEYRAKREKDYRAKREKFLGFAPP